MESFPLGTPPAKQPWAFCPEPDRAMRPIARLPTRKDPMKKILLIVDDDIAVCEGLKVALELDDYNVHTSNDASAAVETVRGEPPALVIIDCNMPNMTGSRATELIRSIPSDVPIIGISAELHREEEMRAAGVTTFLPKPLDMDRLTRTIAQLLAGEPVT